MAHEDPQKVLSYHGPQRVPSDHPDPLRAMLLCLPAMICWALFFGIITRLSRLPRSLYWLALLIWLAGIVTAIYSFMIYYQKRKPWYVVLSLIINWSGIIFTISPVGWLSAYALFHGFKF